MLFDDDEKLIRKALNGNERAWVKLVKRYEKRIYNYSLRMTGATDEAMDLVQEVFLAVFRNLPNYRGDGVFPAWLFRIANNRTVPSTLASLMGQAFLIHSSPQVTQDAVDLESLPRETFWVKLAP